MKIVSWVSGLLGIIMAIIGLFNGIQGDVAVQSEVTGRLHAPSTFVLMGILLLLVGIWSLVLVLLYRDCSDDE